MNHIETGKRGEQIAVDDLAGRGYLILARNVRMKGGEIDIVVRDPRGPIAIVEVKTRSSTRFGTGAEAITPVKYARLRRLAGQWLRENPQRCEARIDVVSILLDGHRYTLEHIEGVLP
ncbi:MAG: YraN family protein [Ruaniaceae bacterium]|nr:YraN family protein [Ruaniaceae bacterium]